MTLTNTTYNIITDQISVRDYTPLEISDYEKQKEENFAQNLALQAEAVTKATAKAAAQAKLAALGLTTDDLKALGLGGN